MCQSQKFRGIPAPRVRTGGRLCFRPKASNRCQIHTQFFGNWVKRIKFPRTEKQTLSMSLCFTIDKRHVPQSWRGRVLSSGHILLWGCWVGPCAGTPSLLLPLFKILSTESLEVVLLPRNAPPSDPIMGGSCSRWFTRLQIKVCIDWGIYIALHRDEEQMSRLSHEWEGLGSQLLSHRSVCNFRAGAESGGCKTLTAQFGMHQNLPQLTDRF